MAVCADSDGLDHVGMTYFTGRGAPGSLDEVGLTVAAAERDEVRLSRFVITAETAGHGQTLHPHYSRVH